jgi:hypothetical protein
VSLDDAFQLRSAGNMMIGEMNLHRAPHLTREIATKPRRSLEAYLELR